MSVRPMRLWDFGICYWISIVGPGNLFCTCDQWVYDILEFVMEFPSWGLVIYFVRVTNESMRFWNLLWNSHLGACSYWGTFQWFLWQMSDGLEINWKILTTHNWQIPNMVLSYQFVCAIIQQIEATQLQADPDATEIKFMVETYGGLFHSAAITHSCWEHSSIMESHWHRALFLAAGTVAIHWRAGSGLKKCN
jgi:hypothetical protein